MENPGEAVATSQRARILVVEDDEDLRLTICEWLSLQGHAVSAAVDGLEALAIASEQSFDVVVTDYKMPRCDGLHMLSALKARDPRVQVIFLTGQAKIEDAIEALREGRSFDFLQKPLHDLRRLDQVIARALAQRQAPSSLPDAGTAAPAPHSAWPPAVAEAIANEPALLRAFHFMEAHFREPIGLREVAAATEYSPAYLTNRMRLKTGKTVQQWIRAIKMAEAQRLLATTDASAQEIAETLGYSAANYFHRQFRQASGVSPQAWRQENAPPSHRSGPSPNAQA